MQEACNRINTAIREGEGKDETSLTYRQAPHQEQHEESIDSSCCSETALSIGRNGSQSLDAGTMDHLASGLKHREVFISGKEDGCISFCGGQDKSGDAETYIVIQLRHCQHGFPLLPTVDADGSVIWAIAPDPHIPFATWLVMTMERLTGENWKYRILPHFYNTLLVRYQAAVEQKDWRKIWDVLLKPFYEQTQAYKTYHKSKRAPEMFFGVEAKPLEQTQLRETESTSSEEHARRPPISDIDLGVAHEGRAPTPAADASEAGRRTDVGQGMCLPNAAAWLEFWQNTEVPVQNTFVDFVDHISQRGFRRRINSAPDVVGRQ